MTRFSRPPRPSDDLVDDDYRYLLGFEDEMSTLDLYNAGPDQYLKYCKWYQNRLDSRRVRNPKLRMEIRIVAYLRLIAEQGQRFELGRDAIPSSKWLRERLDIHRNTMGKYIKDAQTTGRVQLTFNVGCQLAFAAAIYPRQSNREKNAVQDALENRLDLIDDYHITGKDKTKMVRHLSPIVRTGKNNLFTSPKVYPCQYDLSEKMRPIKRISEHTARTTNARTE